MEKDGCKDDKNSIGGIFWRVFSTTVSVFAASFLVFSVVKSYLDVRNRNEAVAQWIAEKNAANACDCKNMQVCLGKKGTQYCLDESAPKGRIKQ